jgi:hypothetical protein
MKRHWLVSCLVIVASCNWQNGLTQVSGTVTWRGKPVPLGSVSIEPDAAQGGRGPQSRNMLNRGRYVSRSGFGAVSGPVIVDVEGYGVPENSELPVPLFPPYRFRTVIPERSSHTLDIVVPEARASGRESR